MPAAPAELDGGRPLRRLLAIATLTSRQAALISIGVLDGLRTLHEAGVWHGRLDERTVYIGRAGQVRLEGWGLDDEAQDIDERRARDRFAAVHLLGRLGRSVRHSGGAVVFLGALEACRVGGGEATVMLAQVRETAAALLEGGAGEDAARELAALIGRLERDPAPGPPKAAAPSHPLRSPDALWTPAAGRKRWVGAGLLLVVLAGAAAGLGLAARHAPARSLAVMAHPRPASTHRPPAPTPSPSPASVRPVPVPAPPAAGPITAIQLQPLRGSCHPDAVCPVQVTVRLQPQPAAQVVRWSFRVFDRCKGTTSTLPGASVTALAGWAYVYGTSWPVLTASHSLALVAVSETPAAAASPALLAGWTDPC